MEFFADALIVLSLALLTIIIAIFVLAVSFLGRAIEHAKKEEERINKEEADVNEKIIGLARAELDRASASGDGVTKARIKLQTLERKREWFNKKREKATNSYKLLTVNRGILCPSATLLISVIFAATSRYLTTISGIPAQVFSYISLVLASLGAIWASFRIYKTLLIVQNVAVVPEEVQRERDIQVYEKALERHEDKHKPQLLLEFVNPEPPFEFEASSKKVLEFIVYVSKSPANSIVVEFCAPDGLLFPDKPNEKRVECIAQYPGALHTIVEVGELQENWYQLHKITLQTPEKEGKYLLAYSTSCNERTGEFIEQQVIVKS